MQAKRWIISDCDEKQKEKLSQELAVSPYIAEILLKRGISTYQEALEFLNPQLQNLSHPLEILNMAAAAEKIWQSIEKKDKITVYGDYDVDGMCASAILYEGLKDLGADVSSYVPDRIEEGYGLNQKAIESIAQKGCGLLVTVDCGISSAKEAAFARQLGLEVVITDHHQLPEVLPNCIIVNPALAGDKKVKWGSLCGAGVSFKLVQALYIWKYGEKGLWEKTRKLLDLVALATIADIVPLKGDNRILVKFGLQLIEQGGRIGLKELAKVAGGNYPIEITPIFVSFGLAPRLNACGRIGDVQMGLELLLTKDKNRAWAIAKRLDDENRDRQNIEKQIYDEVLEIIEKNQLDTRRGIVVYGENWHPGVIGIVASRIAEKFYTPAIIFTRVNDIYKGSGRSIEGFHLQQGLSKCADILASFGGHAQAAGLSIKKEKVAEFIQRFGDLLAQSDAQIFLPKIKVDCVLDKDSINYGFYNELNRLQPFGMQNPAPVFVIRGLKASESREVGINGDHLKVKFIAYKGDLNAIGFKKAYLADLVSRQKVDVAFNLEKNNFNGHTTLQLNICDIKSQERSDELNMLDKLFFYSEEYLKDDPYKHLADKNEFYTKVVGVTFENRQSLLADLLEGQELELKREKDNEYDHNAIAVYAGENHIGYLKREIARQIAPNMDENIIYQAMVTQLTGSDKEIMGVNIFISRKHSATISDEYCEQKREELEKLSAEEISREIRKILLGAYDYRPKQQEALDALMEGKNVFLIMGTGRGKTAVFQSYGAYLALKEKKRTVIIYPLRALVNDQYLRLKEKMSLLGIDAVKATGEMTAEERTEFFHKLANGGADIILTTPEFFSCNRKRLLTEGRIDFIVLDEAHHLSQRRKGYRQMLQFLGSFSGQILAVTATAADEVWQKIKKSINFEQMIIDKHIRENLILDDQRGVKEKTAWLAELLANEEKTIVYVNSRRKAVEIAQSLRERCQNKDLQKQICYYHGGLEARDRKMIENNFRQGKLKFIVSTSAFGEGIDIGDIKHVVLYHLSFSCEEYNQLAGRAGRNGEKAYIHLLYNEKDKRVNELLLTESCPQREVLASFYKALRALARKGEIKMTNEELAQSTKNVKGLSEKAVSHWLGIFEELGFLSREVSGSKRTIIINERPNKANLEDSLRYTEGLAELEDYEKYVRLAFSPDTEELLQAINKPIYPKEQGGEKYEI